METKDAVLIGGVGLIAYMVLSRPRDKEEESGGGGGITLTELPDIFNLGGGSSGSGESTGLITLLTGLLNREQEGLDYDSLIDRILGLVQDKIPGATDTEKDGESIWDAFTGLPKSVLDILMSGETAFSLFPTAQEYWDKIKAILEGRDGGESGRQGGGEYEAPSAWEWFTSQPTWLQSLETTAGIGALGYGLYTTRPIWSMVSRTTAQGLSKLLPAAGSGAWKILSKTAPWLIPVSGGFAAMEIGEAIKPEWNWNPLSSGFWQALNPAWWAEGIRDPSVRFDWSEGGFVPVEAEGQPKDIEAGGIGYGVPERNYRVHTIFKDGMPIVEIDDDGNIIGTSPWAVAPGGG